MKTNQIDFSENRNAYMPSKEVLIAYRNAICNLHQYPDFKNTDVNNSIAAFFGLDNKNTTISNGSMEGINLLARILHRQTATLFVPTFWGYEDALKRYGYDINYVGLENNLNYDLNKINIMAKSSDLLFLCNPNNPTLSYIEKEDLKTLIKSSPNCQFVIDETMLMFAKDYDKRTISKEVVNYSNLTVITSFSKLFGLAGIRTGALISNEDIIKGVKSEMTPYSVGSIVQQVLPVALSDKVLLEETRGKIAENRRRLCEYIELAGDYTTIEGLTNFILVQLPNGIEANKLTNYLMQNNMVVRNINEAYPLLSGEWIRISINTDENNKILVNEIENYQKTLKL